MKKTFALALSAALAAGLALAGLSVGASDRSRVATLDGADAGKARLAARAFDKYKGRFKRVPNSKITIKAKTRRGVPIKVKRMTYRNLPADCPKSGSPVIRGGWTLVGVRVNARRRFKVVGSDEAGTSSLRFSGRFSANYNKVRGRFQTTVSFPKQDDPPLPAETCTSETERYVARR